MKMESILAAVALKGCKLPGVLLDHHEAMHYTLARPCLWSVAIQACSALVWLQNSAMNGSPSASSVASQLTTFRTTLPSPTALNSLIGNLTNLEASLLDATTGFPSATTQTYLAWVTSTRYLWQCTDDVCTSVGSSLLQLHSMTS